MFRQFSRNFQTYPGVTNKTTTSRLLIAGNWINRNSEDIQFDEVTDREGHLTAVSEFNRKQLPTDPPTTGTRMPEGPPFSTPGSWQWYFEKYNHIYQTNLGIMRHPDIVAIMPLLLDHIFIHANLRANSYFFGNPIWPDFSHDFLFIFNCLQHL